MSVRRLERLILAQWEKQENFVQPIGRRLGRGWMSPNEWAV